MYGFLYISMEKSNHKLIFDEFGSRKTLLGILVVIDSFRLDLKLFWFGFGELGAWP